MIRYLAGRLVTMAWTLLAISVLVFVIIQLPPGDYLTSYIAEIRAQGENVTVGEIDVFARAEALGDLVQAGFAFLDRHLGVVEQVADLVLRDRLGNAGLVGVAARLLIDRDHFTLRMFVRIGHGTSPCVGRP